MKMKIKNKNRSHGYYINRPRPWHGYKYAKYKKFPSIWRLYITSNNWSSIHEKVKQHWGLVKKSVAYKRYLYLRWSSVFGMESQDSFQQLIVFRRSSILAVWECSEFVSDYLNMASLPAKNICCTFHGKYFS